MIHTSAGTTLAPASAPLTATVSWGSAVMSSVGSRENMAVPVVAFAASVSVKSGTAAKSVPGVATPSMTVPPPTLTAIVWSVA